jgi:hypothetical protein
MNNAKNLKIIGVITRIDTMRIDANNIDELFERSGDQEELLRLLDEIIVE